MNKKLIEAVQAFNKLYPIGTQLILVDDMGIEHKRKLVSKAWIVGSHSAIAKFEGLSGGYDIKRVKQVLKYKTNDLGMSYLVPADANGIAL
tara:strand:- start:53937 stop:54209 length:273 start_codon:yes stop_codon:yes gene_type:complete